MKVSTLELLVFINQAVYCYALIPLIAENYRLKTARGLSDGLVWSMFNAFMVLGFYFFCLDLPICYRVSLLIQLIFTAVLIFQRFWYDDFSYKKALGVIYLVNLALAAACIPLAIAWPYEVGNIAGWMGVVLGVVNRIPQIIKIQRERSVYGFNYWFAFLLGIAAVLEIIIVVLYKLPMQTLATASWALISFIIFTWQFYNFSWRR